jgi:hypothetical protein
MLRCTPSTSSIEETFGLVAGALGFAGLRKEALIVGIMFHTHPSSENVILV